MGTGELFKNRRFVTFLIFGFFFYVGTAFESNFLPYLMTSIEIDSTNIGLVLSVRALMEIPFLYFIVKLRRRFQLRYLIMLAAVFMGVECLLLGFFRHLAAGIRRFRRILRPRQRAVPRHGDQLHLRDGAGPPARHGARPVQSPSRRLPAFSATCSAASCSTRWAASRFT